MYYINFKLRKDKHDVKKREYVLRKKERKLSATEASIDQLKDSSFVIVYSRLRIKI
jgi:hypothetical protein